MRRFAVILSFIVVAGIAMSFLIQHARRAACSDSCVNSLRLVGLNLQNYASANGRLPAAATYDESGRPRYSWRFAVIEFAESFYFDFGEHIDRSQPWNADCNTEFLQRYDDNLFRCASSTAAAGVTQYVAIVGPGTAWDSNISIDNLRDETLLAIEWPQSDVYWAEPRDLSLADLQRSIDSMRLIPEHSSSLRYLDWSATVHEIPLDESTFATVKRLASVSVPSKAARTPAK